MFSTSVNFVIYVCVLSCSCAPIPNDNGETNSATNNFDKQVENELNVFNTFANDISNSEQRGEFKGQLKMLVRRALNAEAKVEQLNFEKGGLNIEKNNERKMKLILQSLIDVREVINRFLTKCYPPWAGNRNENEFKPEYWRMVFLNVENPDVIALKHRMMQKGLSEEDFITASINFVKLRNDKAHYKLGEEDRKVGYPLLQKVSEDEEKTFLDLLISYMYGPKYTNEELEQVREDVIEQTKPALQLYKLLKISELSFGNDESDIRKAIKNAKAVYVNGNLKVSQAYILFDSFEDARTAWSHLRGNSSMLTRFEKQSTTIEDVENVALYNNECFLKIEMYSSQDKIDTLSDLINLIKNTEPNPQKTYIPSTKTSKRTLDTTKTKLMLAQKPEIVFVKYHTFEHTLLAYENYKTTLLSPSFVVTIT